MVQGKAPRQRKRVRIDPEERRAKILDEAIRLIGERGYNGLTIPELAKRCGLTNGGLLYHFGSKEELLRATLDEVERRLESAMRAYADRHDDRKQPGGALSLAAVLELLRMVVALPITEPGLTRLMAMLQTEAMDVAHPAHDYFSKQQGRWLETFRQVVSPLVEDAQSVALQISALVQGFQAFWLQTGGSFDLLAEWDKAIVKILSPAE